MRSVTFRQRERNTFRFSLVLIKRRHLLETLRKLKDKQYNNLEYNGTIMFLQNLRVDSFIEIQHVRTKLDSKTHLLQILIIIKEDIHIKTCNVSTPY